MFKDVVVYDMKYAGVEWTEKVSSLRDQLRDYSGMIVSELDELAWLFNLRGEGESNNEGLFNTPVFQSLALVTHQELLLWLHLDQVREEVRQHLVSVNMRVEIRDLEHSVTDLTQWFSLHPGNHSVLLTSPSTYQTGVSWSVYSAVPDQRASLQTSPIINMKAVKNSVEEAGMVEAHIR